MLIRYNRALMVGFVVLAAGCGRAHMPWQRGISADQFVQAIVELRRAATAASGPADYEQRKRVVEGRLRVTDADLRQFTRDHGDDVKTMSAAWDSVEARLSRYAGNGPSGRPLGPIPPGLKKKPFY